MSSLGASKEIKTLDSAGSFKVYKPPSEQSSSATSNDLPDSYFEPTVADLSKFQASLAARASALANAPLQLRVIREAEEKRKRERWPNVTIRVRFPDRTQLEKVFPSTDKIRTVYAFVRSSLREDVKPIKFILYQSPPIRDLKVSDPKVRDLTLAELQLAPSSILLLRFVDESLNHIDIQAPLAPAILSQATDLPAPARIDAKIPETQSKGQSSTIPQSGDRKVPKWLKLGQKK